ALRYNPNEYINPNNILDPSVIPFFNQIKGELTRTASSNHPRPGPTKSKVAGTLLLVNSNVQNASISINGIIAGQDNSELNVNSGKTVIQVTAPGHLTRKVQVNIAANQKNVITVNLSKPRPKKAIAANKPRNEPSKRRSQRGSD